MNNYVKIHVDALKAYSMLTDTEFGRGMRAILRYAADGTEPNLTGKECVMYGVLREQVERDREAYSKKIAAQTENGKKGGRPRKNPTKPNETQQNPWVFEKPNETQKTQEKEKEKEKEYSSSLPSFIPDDDADAIAAEHSRVLDAAQAAGFPRNTATFDRLTALIAEYGAAWVEAAIARCVEQGTQKLSYLSAVLAGYKREGGPAERKQERSAWEEHLADLRARGIEV